MLSWKKTLVVFKLNSESLWTWAILRLSLSLMSVTPHCSASRGAVVKGQLIFSLLLPPVRFKSTIQLLEVLRVQEEGRACEERWLVTGVNTVGVVKRRGRGRDGWYLVKAGKVSCRSSLSICSQGMTERLIAKPSSEFMLNFYSAARVQYIGSDKKCRCRSSTLHPPYSSPSSTPTMQKWL